MERVERTFESTVFGKNTNIWDVYFVSEFINEVVNRAFFLNKSDDNIFVDKGIDGTLYPINFTFVPVRDFPHDPDWGDDMEVSVFAFLGKYAEYNEGIGNVFSFLNYLISNKETQHWIDKSIGLWIYANFISKYYGCTRDDFDINYRPKGKSTELTNDKVTDMEFHLTWDYPTHEFRQVDLCRKQYYINSMVNMYSLNKIWNELRWRRENRRRE